MMIAISRLCCLFILFITATSQLALADEYVSVIAQKGDGVLALLRKFELDGYSCNQDHFYSINKLERNAHLKLGKEYLLPIHVKAFNGKSIGSSLGIEDWKIRKRIQDYNDRMYDQRLREAPFQEDKRLWVPHHEFKCPIKDQVPSPPPTPLLAENPEVNKEGVFPIFGPSYEKVPYFPNPKLTGKVFYLVSGHGGPDPGAIGKYGSHSLCEDEYAYDVTLRLARLLIKDGAKVYIITRDPNDGIRSGKILNCDTDERHWGDTPMHHYQKPRLTQRSDIINSLYAANIKKGVPAADQKVIIIHIDSRATNQRVDVFFYHQEDKTESRQTAKNLMQTFKAYYKKYQPNRSYFGRIIYRDLFMIENCIPTTIYVELGNIRHPVDLQRILLEKNRQLVAQWMLEGLRKE